MTNISRSPTRPHACKWSPLLPSAPLNTGVRYYCTLHSCTVLEYLSYSSACGASSCPCGAATVLRVAGWGVRGEGWSDLHLQGEGWGDLNHTTLVLRVGQEYFCTDIVFMFGPTIWSYLCTLYTVWPQNVEVWRCLSNSRAIKSVCGAALYLWAHWHSLGPTWNVFNCIN